MLALNSYGLAASRPGAGSGPAAVRASLPRLCGGGGLPAAREIRSLSKMDLLARTTAHPLYRTTSGFDYGRYLDFKDVALSCPKHGKAAGFTREFIAGNFADSSLLSLEQSKQRAESWQRKVVARTRQMQLKYEELQLLLEERKEQRRLTRERRRREAETRRNAATCLQARARGFVTRRRLREQKLRRDTQAALCIQRVARSHARVRVAKQALAARKRHKQSGFAVKIQRVARGFLRRAEARRELERRREARRQQLRDQELAEQLQRHEAACCLQRVARGHLARKTLSRQYSNASGLQADKDDKDALLSASGRARSRGTRRALAHMQQVRRKRDKSMARSLLSTPPK